LEKKKTKQKKSPKNQKKKKGDVSILSEGNSALITFYSFRRLGKRGGGKDSAYSRIKKGGRLALEIQGFL